VTRTPEEAVRGLWQTLSAREWDRLGDFLADDCIYVDMPVGPAFAARGPGDIVKRLQVGLAELAGYENHDGLLVADGDAVMYEHAETWTFATGQVVELPFATVHRVRDGRVTLWKDYWDFGTVVNAAPPGWLDKLGEADTSWIFDATGLV
jgi:ketosteroid isomerase-like protein